MTHGVRVSMLNSIEAKQVVNEIEVNAECECLKQWMKYRIVKL